MSVLGNLEPKSVFAYFEDICGIPHGSGNLDGISSYLEQFARERGLACIRDACNNIIIVKEASAGYEQEEPIILQGHMDMVAVKESDCDMDLARDGLRLRTEGDFVYAEGTSLGGDDGIAVAYILAVLADDTLCHPRIEAVITTDEEVGMGGASAIDLSTLTARRMLNIDSEEEGVLLASCAGGLRTECHIPVKREQRAGAYIKLAVSGLAGGHSGTEIHKERANAIKLLGITLQQLLEDFPIQLAQMAGGEKDNAIPREAWARIYVPENQRDALCGRIAQIAEETQRELASKEAAVRISVCEETTDSGSVLDGESTRRAAAFLVLLPNGVVAMSADMEGLVETSLNTGILELRETELVTCSAVRSAIESAKQKLRLQLEVLAKAFGGFAQTGGDYPGWQFDPESRLRAVMVDIYKEMFGKEAVVEALHAGLECGIMVSKLPGLDCVSFGPDIYDIHTTKERLSISSTERMWRYLLAILAHKK